MSAELNIDELDLKLIQKMMENADHSYAELGEELFVSAGTIHVRIKKLTEMGVIKNKILKVDYKKIGLDVVAFVGVYLEKSSLYDSVAKQLKKIPQDKDYEYFFRGHSDLDFELKPSIYR